MVDERISGGGKTSDGEDVGIAGASGLGLVWVIWSVQLYWGGCGVSVGINLAEE